MKINLSTKICGQKLKTPLIIPSGIIENNKLFLKIDEEEIGAVTTKSLTVRKRLGNPFPQIAHFEHGTINSVGLRNPGIKEGKKQFKILLKKSRVPLIFSLAGFTIEEFKLLVSEIAPLKPDFLEINISCSNVESEFGTSFALNPKISAKATKAVKNIAQKYQVPVIVKLSPNTHLIKEVARAVEAEGADVISAINTVGPGMLIDIKRRRPILGAKKGGISGPAIRPIALRCVYDIFETVKIPIIGIGGISSGKDVLAMIMAGATAVGVGSVFYKEGLDIFPRILQEIKEIMQKEGIKNLEEIKGVAHL